MGVRDRACAGRRERLEVATGVPRLLALWEAPGTGSRGLCSWEVGRREGRSFQKFQV